MIMNSNTFLFFYLSWLNLVILCQIWTNETAGKNDLQHFWLDCSGCIGNLLVALNTTKTNHRIRL